MEIKLGHTVKSKISGFQGIAVAKQEHLNGCIRFSIQPRIDKDGNLPAGYWIDAHELEILDPTPVVTHTPTNKGGLVTKATRD